MYQPTLIPSHPTYSHIPAQTKIQRHPSQTNPKNNPTQKTNHPHKQKLRRETPATPILTKDKIILRLFFNKQTGKSALKANQFDVKRLHRAT
jgi:hypothetical protein